MVALFSVVVIARWAFEALGHDLGLASLLAKDPSGADAARLTQHGRAFDHNTVAHWFRLALFTSVFLSPPPRSSCDGPSRERQERGTVM